MDMCLGGITEKFKVFKIRQFAFNMKSVTMIATLARNAPQGLEIMQSAT